MSRKARSDLTGERRESQPNERLTQKQYADLKGWSKQYVNQLVKKGRISLVDGKIDPALADLQLAMVQDPSRAGGNETEAHESSGKDDQSSAPSAATVSHFGRARTAREHYRAMREKLEYEQLIGRVVDRKGVEEAMFDCGRMVRDEILRSVKQVAERVANKVGGDPREVASIIGDELRRCMNEAADKLEDESRVAEGLTSEV